MVTLGGWKSSDSRFFVLAMWGIIGGYRLMGWLRCEIKVMIYCVSVCAGSIIIVTVIALIYYLS